MFSLAKAQGFLTERVKILEKIGQSKSVECLWHKMRSFDLTWSDIELLEAILQ